MHNFEIQSHKGAYSVEFDNNLFDSDRLETLGTHYIIDKNVFPSLAKKFSLSMRDKHLLLVDATEETKSYKGVEPIINQLLKTNLRRDSKLVAIGGGITQDITCFIANTFMRGISWTFVPTTVLAQADSCIGSKSSINFSSYKNILGSFTPPNSVIISDQFLDTLLDKDIKSGIGEIIKLFIIDGKVISPEEITRDNISNYIFQALQIKKKYIEVDEFDKGIRNILNYGHCIGHGIESATDFAIPHGIAITMGMDVVNKFSEINGFIDKKFYGQMHTILFNNYKDFLNISIDADKVCNALTKDKKNTGSNINIILPVDYEIKKMSFESNKNFWSVLLDSCGQVPISFRSYSSSGSQASQYVCHLL